jgi:hypothetical protein
MTIWNKQEALGNYQDKVIISIHLRKQVISEREMK